MARRRKKKTNGELMGLVGAAGFGCVALKLAWDFMASHAVVVTLVVSLLVLMVIGVKVLAARDAARKRLRRAELDRNIAVTDGMTGPAFEQYVARLMNRSGFRRVKVAGSSGDRGADIIAYTPDGRRVVVQCKRYAGTVGDPLIQQFNGTVRAIHGADVALFVTTGRPTAPARELAAMVGIILVDRNDLAAWVTDGVPPVPGWPRREQTITNPKGTDGLSIAPETP